MTPETVVTLLLSAIQIAKELGIDVTKMNELIEKARSEGRDITDEELKRVADEARSSVDRL